MQGPVFCRRGDRLSCDERCLVTCAEEVQLVRWQGRFYNLVEVRLCYDKEQREG